MAMFSVIVEFEVNSDDEDSACKMLESALENLIAGDIVSASIEDASILVDEE